MIPTRRTSEGLWYTNICVCVCLICSGDVVEGGQGSPLSRDRDPDLSWYLRLRAFESKEIVDRNLGILSVVLWERRGATNKYEDK